MVHVWCKRCSPEDEGLWLTKLSLAGHDDVVVTSRPHRKTVNLEIYAQDAARAALLKEHFGGRVGQMADDEMRAALKSAQRPIEIKIRDRLLVTSQSGGECLEELRRAHPQRRVLSIPPELAFGTGDHSPIL